MGVWALDAFGNDGACDWAGDLIKTKNLSLVESAIDAVLKTGSDYLEAPLAEEALAAIEVIARLRGHWGIRNAYSEAVDRWVAEHRFEPPEALVQNAARAIDRIVADDSEIKELWVESGKPEAWLDSVGELRQRLAREPDYAAAASPVDASGQQKAEPADPVENILRRTANLKFVVPDLPSNPLPVVLYRAMLASLALGEFTLTSEYISRMHQAYAALEKETVLWDLAVRDANILAAEGWLDEALADLEAWKGSSALSSPGTYEGRANSVCQYARDYARALMYSVQSCEAAKDDPARQVDQALLEARFGSTDKANDIVGKVPAEKLSDLAKPFVLLVKGIAACRSHDASAFDWLREATTAMLASAASSPGSWPTFTMAATWYAIELDRRGRRRDAEKLVELVAPVLVKRPDQPLFDMLEQHGLLPEKARENSKPEKTSAEAAPRLSRTTDQRSGLEIIQSRGVNALKWVERYRRDFANGSRRYPFLIGDADEVESFLEMIDPPSDGGAATIRLAKELDVAAWFKQNGMKSAPRWPNEEIAGPKTVLSQYDLLSQKLKSELFIGLIELDDPSELFAKLGFGGWNDCPEPHVHVALHAYWRERFGAEPVAVSADVVECLVAAPPTERKAASSLACEQNVYCYDIVEQGIGSVAKLAASLLGSKYWYFWWD